MCSATVSGYVCFSVVLPETGFSFREEFRMLPSVRQGSQIKRSYLGHVRDTTAGHIRSIEAFFEWLERVIGLSGGNSGRELLGISHQADPSWW